MAPAVRYMVAMAACAMLLCVYQVGMLSRRVPGSTRQFRQGFGFSTSPDCSRDSVVVSVHPTNTTTLPTIFVSVASFRDWETNSTLHSLFARARYPQRVFVGLICQVEPGNVAEICLPPLAWDEECGTQDWCPADQIRSRTFNAKHAKGPTFARHLATMLYRGEDYFMMIDSHNKFVKHWDEVVLEQHAKTGKLKSVLSTYPMAINPNDETKEEPSIAFLCALGKNGGWTAGFPGPFWANSYHPADYPKPQPYLGAGLVFGPGAMVIDVPFDPHLPYLFFGEEFLLGIRLWTKGYDLYSPGVNILYHRYSRKGPRMESHGSKVHTNQARAHKRIQHILGITKPGTGERIVDINTKDPLLSAELPKYGLGTVRSLWQYWNFSRLDPIVQNPQTFQDHWCTTYGPKRGPYDTKWKEYAKENDLDPSEWWQNGVAKLSVPSNHPSLLKTLQKVKKNPNCKDEYEECPGWAASGECDKNPNLKDLCKVSCGKC